MARSLAPLTDAVPEFADASADLERLADEAREIAYALRRFGQGWDDDPDRLEEVETRLALYRRLATRYRCSADDLADSPDDLDRQSLPRSRPTPPTSRHSTSRSGSPGSRSSGAAELLTAPGQRLPAGLPGRSQAT